jgi:hypothetical protein
VGSAALVWLGTSFALGVEGFAVVNLVIGMVWLLLIVRLARQHRAIAEAHPKAASHATGPR